MKERNSFRGAFNPFCTERETLFEDFAADFKASGFYTDIYLKHKNELIIGVRDGYINFYHNCNSIAKFDIKKRPLTAKINEYYTNKKMGSMTSDEMFELYGSIKENSNARDKKEKQAQQQLYLLNNGNPNSEWFCVDVEFAKSLKGKSYPEKWRFDLIAISKTSPHRVAFIELKYGKDAIGGKSGIRDHIKDFTKFNNNKELVQEVIKEVVSIVCSLKILGVNVPVELQELKSEDICPQPEYYFITLNNTNDGRSTPKQSMSGYLFKDKRWGCKRISTLIDKEGEMRLVPLNPVFLFSEAQLPDLGIDDILGKQYYDIESSVKNYSPNCKK